MIKEPVPDYGEGRETYHIRHLNENVVRDGRCRVCYPPEFEDHPYETLVGDTSCITCGRSGSYIHTNPKYR